MYRRRLYARLIAAAVLGACFAQAGAREWSVYTSGKLAQYPDRQPEDAARFLGRFGA